MAGYTAIFTSHRGRTVSTIRVPNGSYSNQEALQEAWGCLADDQHRRVGQVEIEMPGTGNTTFNRDQIEISLQ